MINLYKRRTAVYRFYDADNQLLYVGVTANPKARWNAHARDKEWWPEVASKAIQWFGDRHPAEFAEYVAIQTEGPKYNRHPAPWPRPPVPHLDPEEQGIDFVEWVIRKAQARGFRIGTPGAVSSLAYAGGTDAYRMRRFLNRGSKQPLGVAFLRALAKALDMSFADLMIRAGVATAEDFSRGSVGEAVDSAPSIAS